LSILRVAPAIFAEFPGAVLGVVIAHSVNNGIEDPHVMAALREAEQHAAHNLAGRPIPEHPQIAPWRDAYRKFGAKPKDHLSSVENLLRNVAKQRPLRHINTLVDIYNAVSLRHVVPVGGEDLDTIAGDVHLTFATSEEAPVRLLGESDERPPHAGEVIYKDDKGAICRRWNWKEADRTKLTAGTRNAFLVIEGLPPVEADRIKDAATDLASQVRKYCGGNVAAAFIDASCPDLPLTPR
jgi:DNA/RNA-binding domain of Phe-tRNA-synthetase-like protein